MGAEYSDTKRKLLEKYLRGEFGVRPEAQRITPRPPGERIPLSHAQEQVSDFMRKWLRKFRFTTNR